jgi:enamine deaminase RidA (YjgF/YER057c/UK114 family)
MTTSQFDTRGEEVDESHPLSQSALVAPKGSGFAPVVTVGDYVFVAGQMAHHGGDIGVDPSAHVHADGVRWSGTEIKLQAELVISELIHPALAAAESSLAHVVKAQVYLTHVEDIPQFMEVWQAHFPNHPCALSVVPTEGLGLAQGLIEINVMALKHNAATQKEIIACDMPSTMAYGALAVRAGDLLLPIYVRPIPAVIVKLENAYQKARSRRWRASTGSAGTANWICGQSKRYWEWKCCGVKRPRWYARNCGCICWPTM